MDIIDLWGGSSVELAKSCGVSRNTVYNWTQAGAIPASRRAEIVHEIIPKQKEKLERMEKLEKELDDEFGRGLFEK